MPLTHSICNLILLHLPFRLHSVLKPMAEIGIHGLVVGSGEAGSVVGACGVIHVILVVVATNSAVAVATARLRDHLGAKKVTISSISSSA